MMAIAGTFVAAVGAVTRTPTYVFYDTEHATVSNLLAYPFATCVYVPRAYLKPIHWRHQRYDGYHELAYLHPDFFQPDASVLEEAGLKRGERFALVRFVGWSAGHDIGHQGLTLEQKRRAVEALSKKARVLISAEGPLPADLQEMRLQCPVARIHHLMSFASLVFGESGTMPSEASVLGVPSVYINPLRLGYLEEQERQYSLVSNHRPAQFREALERGVRVLEEGESEKWKQMGRRLIADKVNVTEMLHRIALELPFTR